MKPDNWNRFAAGLLAILLCLGSFSMPVFASGTDQMCIRDRPTGATQNVKDLLSSPEIENILENSDFITLLNQASGDRKILSERLNLSADRCV